MDFKRDKILDKQLIEKIAKEDLPYPDSNNLPENLLSKKKIWDLFESQII